MLPREEPYIGFILPCAYNTRVSPLAPQDCVAVAIMLFVLEWFFVPFNVDEMVNETSLHKTMNALLEST